MKFTLVVFICIKIKAVYRQRELLFRGPNTEQDTRDFLEECIRKTEEDPVTQFEYAVTLKENRGDGDTDGKIAAAEYI